VPELIKLDYLVPTKTYAPPPPDLRGIKVQAGDYVVDQLGERMNDDGLVGDIVTNWFKRANGLKTICFAVNVAHSQHIAAEFVRAGIAAEHVDGSTPTQQRDRILKRLASGMTTVVSNCMVLTEGREQEWRAAGYTVAWIDTRPKWLSVICWSWDKDCLADAPLTDPDKPCRRAWRFSLIGGGQIKIIEHWSDSHPDLGGVWNPRIDIRVAAHVGDQLHHYRGEIDDILGEMQAAAILLRSNSDDVQAIADRVALTLRGLTEDESAEHAVTPPDQDRFYALLDGARGCSVCGRPLRDEISKLLAIGPDCARQMGIPDSRAAASKRLELRAQILGAAA
jgi:hypothetical protein